tara:strand:+ start:1270 stop:2046 length:777 start_codon:yes stop_codon:yes gene_type:complete
MLGNPYFYRSTIRNYVIAFGSMFNDVQIQRTNASDAVIYTRDVPLAYGPVEKYLSRINTINDSGGQNITLPRMAFEIAGFQYAADRKLSKVGKISRQNVASTGSGASEKNVVYQPVPYDISFTLSIMTKNADDATQIIEQILPYFTPTFMLPIKEVAEMEFVRDTPLTLDSVDYQDEYDGDYLSRRSLIWSLGFTLNGYLYGLPRDQKLIRTAITNTKRLNTTDQFVKVTHTTNPSTALETDNFDFITTFDEDFGDIT